MKRLLSLQTATMAALLLMAAGIATTLFEYQMTPDPEPSTMFLLGCGFLGVAIYTKRRFPAEMKKS